MWLQNNFNLVMIAGLTLIIGLSVGGARKTHKEIKKVLWRGPMVIKVTKRRNEIKSVQHFINYSI
jgi:hypothetical protein